MEQEEANRKKGDRWFKAAIVFTLLYGITFSMISVFNWLFFGALSYSFFMSWFLLPRQAKAYNEGRSFQRGGRQTVDVSEPPSVTPADKARKVVFSVVGIVFGLIAFIAVIGMFGDDDTSDNSTQSGDDVSLDAGDADDGSANSLVAKGNIFFNSQEYDSADKYYDKALALDDQQMEAVYGKGIVLYQRGRVDEATAYLTRSYEGGYRFAWLSWYLGDLYDKKGDAARAIQLYKESVAYDSTYIDSYKRLAVLEPANSAKYLKLAEKYD